MRGAQILRLLFTLALTLRLGAAARWKMTRGNPRGFVPQEPRDSILHSRESSEAPRRRLLTSDVYDAGGQDVEDDDGEAERSRIVAASLWGSARPRQRLYMKPSERSEELQQLVHSSGATSAPRREGHPTLTIFCAPKPYLDATPVERHVDPQRKALISWLRLSWRPTIVLLGNDPSFHRLAREFPGRIIVEKEIDTNFYGVPQFHSIVARAQAANSDISMLVNGDIILLNDFTLAINKVRKTFKNWVLIAARWDLKKDFPFKFDEQMWKQRQAGQSSQDLEREIKGAVRRQGTLHTYGGVDVWVWNNSPVALYAGVMPPFAFGRGKYDNWMNHEMIETSVRDIVDVSEAVTALHVEHDYDHVVVETRIDGTKPPATASFWSTRKKSSWELFCNIHLAQAYGSYRNQKGTALHSPWRLASCFEPTVGNMCLQLRVRPYNCSCEYSNFVARTQTDARTNGKWYTCGRQSVDKPEEFEINPLPLPNSPSVMGLPHTMEQILPQVAREIGGLKVVTLVAVTLGYVDLLMSFVCRLRSLGIADNLVVAALDKETYRFAFTQGLATYYEVVREGLSGFDETHCPFGSQCFRKFTKLKSRAVLRVVQAGYSVLWSDVDIVWFKDPLPDLVRFGPGTFPVQSNEPKATLPGTGIRRINSGFYLARAEPQVVEAFESITAHAATTKLSEQPSFYDILCGMKGERVVQDKEECVWTNGLRTIFLDRAQYPNGAVHDLWDKGDVQAACAEKEAAILHNNWILGLEAKMERFTKNGFWHYDAVRRMCIWPWHTKLPKVIPLHGDVASE